MSEPKKAKAVTLDPEHAAEILVVLDHMGLPQGMSPRMHREMTNKLEQAITAAGHELKEEPCV